MPYCTFLKCNKYCYPIQYKGFYYESHIHNIKHKEHSAGQVKCAFKWWFWVRKKVCATSQPWAWPVSLRAAARTSKRRELPAPLLQHVRGMLKNWDTPTPQQWLEPVVSDEPMNRKESCWGSGESVVAAGQPGAQGWSPTTALASRVNPEHLLDLPPGARAGVGRCIPRGTGDHSHPEQLTPGNASIYSMKKWTCRMFFIITIFFFRVCPFTCQIKHNATTELFSLGSQSRAKLHLKICKSWKHDSKLTFCISTLILSDRSAFLLN